MKKNIILGVTITAMALMTIGCTGVGSNKENTSNSGSEKRTKASGVEGKWEGKKTIPNNEFTGNDGMGGDAVFKETYNFTGNQFSNDFEFEMELSDQNEKYAYGEDAQVCIMTMKGTMTGEYSYDEKSKKLTMIPSTCKVLSQDFDYKGVWYAAEKEAATNTLKEFMKKEDFEKNLLKNSQIFDVISITSDMMSLKDDDGITYTYKSVK